MKNPLIIFVAIVVVAVCGVGAYTLSQNSSQPDSVTRKQDTSMGQTDAVTQEIDSTNVSDTTDSSRYVQYNKQVFDSASTTRRVLFFYASWCPTCKPADASFIQNVSRIPEDLTLIRVNYNDPETDQEEKDLAKKYGITYQHTFVQVDSTGKEVTKWNGGQIDELLSKIK